MKILSYNVHGWFSGEGEHNLEKIVHLVRELKPDIVCLQEASAYGLSKFKEEAGYVNSTRHGGTCIISNMEMTEVPIDRKLLAFRRFVTVEFRTENNDPFYVTCLHLDHRVEPSRMKELEHIRKSIDPLFAEKSAQIWTGDFNSVTKEDYSEEEWEEIAMVRKKNSWEPPKTQVASKMVEMGFEDSWKKVNKPPPTSTCRFNTHIDYVFINKKMEDIFTLESVLHHHSQASDHAPVLATFSLKTTTL